MHKSWIYEQTEFNVNQWDYAMEKHYPETGKWLRNPDDYFVRVCQECNYLNAVELIDWNKYINNNCQILDMGCGGGWLSGFLTRFENTKLIYAMDSSKRFLTELVPQVVTKMNGNLEKIVTIQGLFTPLLYEDASMDVVVASSAFHHAESLEVVLKEVRRVLKKNGVLIILNETPRSWLRYIISIFLALIKILKKSIMKNYTSISPAVSSSGYLYDPFLGDRSYPLWYWKDAIKCSKFSIEEIIDTKMSTVKGLPGISLKHIICKPA